MISVFINAKPHCVVNSLLFKNVSLYRFCLKGGGFSAKLRARDFKTFSKVMNEIGISFKVESDTSAGTFFKKNIVRVGLFAGIALAIFILNWYTSSVTRLQISGNKRISEEVIKAAVTEIIPLPSKKNKVDKDALEKKLTTLDGISSVSAQLKGNTLIIAIYEDLGTVEVEKSPFRTVVSNYDATVTKVIVHSGTEVVKVGDTVKKGALLIGAYNLIHDGLKVQERASGELYGEVWISKDVVFPLTQMKSVRTGREKTKYFRLGSKAKFDCNFSQYERVEETLTVGFIVPIRLVKVTYYETVAEEVSVDFEANKEGLIEEAFARFYLELPENSKKLNMKYELKRFDKYISVRLYYYIETKISAYKQG